MANGVELATAWVRLVPSVEGIQDQITKQFLPAQEEAEKQGDGAGSRWSSGVKKALLGGAIVAGTVAVFKGLYEIGDTFNEVTRTIRIGTGAQGEALGELVDVAKGVATTVPASFDAAATAVGDVNTRFGLTGDLLQTVATQYLEAGRMLGEEIDIGTTSAAFNAFRIEGEGVSEALDDLFRVSQATGIGVNQLAGQIQSNAPAVQALGFDFRDTAALIGVMDKAGLNSTQVMSSMSRSLVNLAKDGEEPQQAFQRVVGELQGFIETGDQAAAIDLAGKVFGTRGASQFIAALESGAIGMEDLMGAAGVTEDTILGLSGETMDFAEKWQITMNSAQVAIEPLATAIFDGISAALDFAMPYLQGLGDWIGENTEAIGIFAGILGVTLVAAFVVWTATVWANTVALLASPVTWITLGIVALIAAIVLLVLNWDQVVEWITEIWSGFIGWITDGIDGFVGWWNDLWEGFANWIIEIWEGFTGWISDLFDQWLLGLRIIGDAIVSWWNGLWGGISDFVTGIWDTIVGWVTGAFDGLVGFFRDTGATIAAVWDSIWSGIGTFLRDTWNNILGWIEGGVNGAIDLINGLTGGIRDVLGFVGIEVGPIPNIRIPRLEDGGSVRRAGIALVGEKGPELLRLPVGAVVDPEIPDFDDWDDGEEPGPVDLSEATLRRLARIVAGLDRNDSRKG